MSVFPREIKDHVVPFPNRYLVDGVQKTIVPDFGIPLLEGTKMNKAYFQPIEDELGKRVIDASYPLKIWTPLSSVTNNQRLLGMNDNYLFYTGGRYDLKSDTYTNMYNVLEPISRFFVGNAMYWFESIVTDGIGVDLSVKRASGMTAESLVSSRIQSGTGYYTAQISQSAYDAATNAAYIIMRVRMGISNLVWQLYKYDIAANTITAVPTSAYQLPNMNNSDDEFLLSHAGASQICNNKLPVLWFKNDGSGNYTAYLVDIRSNSGISPIYINDYNPSGAQVSRSRPTNYDASKIFINTWASGGYMLVTILDVEKNVRYGYPLQFPYANPMTLYNGVIMGNGKYIACASEHTSSYTAQPILISKIEERADVHI